MDLGGSKKKSKHNHDRCDTHVGFATRANGSNFYVQHFNTLLHENCVFWRQICALKNTQQFICFLEPHKNQGENNTFLNRFFFQPPSWRGRCSIGRRSCEKWTSEEKQLKSCELAIMKHCFPFVFEHRPEQKRTNWIVCSAFSHFLHLMIRIIIATRVWVYSLFHTFVLDTNDSNFNIECGTKRQPPTTGHI